MENENSNRTRRMIFRLTPQEYAKIERGCQASTCTKLSDYLRHCLFQRPVVTIYRNGSADDFVKATSRLRSEPNASGNNFNQAVRRLHALAQAGDFKTSLMAFEVQKRTLLNKVEEIKNHI